MTYSEPAFPTVPLNHGYGPQSSGNATGAQTGMTLRDYFAAHAMQGFVAGNWEFDSGNEKAAFALLAKDSYSIADAMLAARKGGA